MQALISIIIPAYNVAEYLPQCLDSVLAQTYTALEIIVIDDGSTDGSGEICDQYARRDERVKVIHKPNGGVSSARNEGLKAATGELIGFVDADDWIEPEMYEKLARAQGAESADVVMCGYYDYPYGRMDAPVRKGIKPLQPCGYEEAVIHIYERNGCFTSLCNKLFARSLALRQGQPIWFDAAICVGEDELWLAKVLRNMHRAAFVPEALYHYRARQGSVTRLDTVTEKQLSVFEAKEQAMAMLPQSERVQELVRSVLYNDCYLMKVRAYCTKDAARWQVICERLKPCKRAWLKCHDAPRLRKAKVLVMEAEMKLRMPGWLVSFTENVKRMH